jgi:hypothetical protein
VTSLKQRAEVRRANRVLLLSAEAAINDTTFGSQMGLISGVAESFASDRVSCQHGWPPPGLRPGVIDPFDAVRQVPHSALARRRLSVALCTFLDNRGPDRWLLHQNCLAILPK